MPRGLILAALGGLAGLTVGLAEAQDRFSNEDPFAPSFRPRVGRVQYFSRSGKTGTLEAREPSTPRFSNRTGEASATVGAAGRSIQSQGAGNSSGFPWAGSDETVDSSRTIHAAHEEPAGTDRSRYVLPVQATEENVSPFSAAPDFGSDRGQSPYDETETGPFGPARMAQPKQSQPTEGQPEARLSGEAGLRFAEQNPDFALRPAEAIPAETGPQTPAVTVEWQIKDNFNIGEECRCDLLVKNSGKVAAHDVAVEAWFPRSVRLVSTEPVPAEATDHLQWHFPVLEPDEEKTIEVRLIPSQSGKLATQATVRFTGAAAGEFHVAEPKLRVALTGPKEVQVGDAATQIVLISNPGSGTAHNVVLEAVIPPGLEHPRGRKLTMDIGSLTPGESRKVRLSLAALEGGEQTVQVEARADAVITQRAVAQVHVIAPSIELAIDGPGLRYLGRNARYLMKVTNDGPAATSNVRVLHKVPDGFEFVKADRGGNFDAGQRTISWFVGRVEPGQTVQVAAELAPQKLGSFVHHADVLSEHGAQAEAKFETKVDGTASLSLEVVDRDDPVEVGRETAWEIRVRNEGTKAAANVAVACELPDGVELIKALGPTDSLARGGQVMFQSLPELPAGKTAVYRVHVRGSSAGQHRFRARLTGDSITEPLTFDELTKFYAD